MWKAIVSGTEWGELLDFVSPSLFDVLPSGDLLEQVKELAGSSRDGAAFERTQRELQEKFGAAQWPVGLTESPKLAAQAPLTSRGQLLLRVYFLQLFGMDTTLLDLRKGRFEEKLEGLRWRPRRLSVRWQPEFIEPLRGMYSGFYDGKDEDFRAGLRALNLDVAEDLFRVHFGEGDQSQVVFHLASFKKNFHDVFVRCREHKRTLHRNFVPLGIYLACLYEHLEGLGRAQDVRQAYQTARAID